MHTNLVTVMEDTHKIIPDPHLIISDCEIIAVSIRPHWKKIHTKNTVKLHQTYFILGVHCAWYNNGLNSTISLPWVAMGLEN